MAAIFRASGYRIVDFSEAADVYVIHTCTVTGESDKKSRNLIRRAVRQNPEAVVAVTGCFAQVSPQAVEKIEGVDLVLGTGSLEKIVQRVEEVRRSGMKSTEVSDFPVSQSFEDLPVHPSGRVRAFLKVQEGCRQYCSYCIIPYARGSVRSRPLHKSIEKAEELVQAGFREIVLTGIRLGAYGEDLRPSLSLSQLVKSMARVKGLERLRLSSVDPNDFTRELIEVITGEPVVCPHYHIPLQSGDDEILAKMGRRYTSGEYLKLIDELRRRRPLAGFATDVMVGFPGEQEKHFNNTKRVVEQAKFMGVHVFRYSPRQGTPAAGLPQQVSNEVKVARSQEVMALAQELFAQYAGQFLNREIEVLFEQRDGEGNWEGHAPNYLSVKLRSELDLKNKLVTVRVTGIGENFVWGEGVN